MRKILGSILLLALVLSAFSLSHAAEELFDTKTALSAMEKGLSLVKVKKYDEAIEQFEQAAAASPDMEAEAYYYIGYAYYLKGKSGDEESRKKSREYFERAYEANPNFSPNKFKPTEPPAALQTQGQSEATPAAAAPSDKPVSDTTGTMNTPAAASAPEQQRQ